MPVEPIHSSIDSGVGFITLQDIEGGNRLHPDSLNALQKALETFLSDATIRLIAIRGASGPGSPFCFGMDLERLEKSLDGMDASLTGNEGRRGAVRAYGEILERISTCDKPVVALVGGPVKAGGVGLVAACDIVLASSSASFELSEVLFGLIPANVLPYLLDRRMGMQRCRYLILSARCLSAPEAQSFGLVDHTFSDESADAEFKYLLKTMLRAEPGALAETKLFLNKVENLNRDQFRSVAVDTLLDLMKRPAVKTALSAFAEGGTPPWFARFKPTGNLFWRTDV